MLLDQGFPKVPTTMINALDHAVEVEHLVDFDPALSQQSTPDWYLYARAAEARFAAFVTRDLSQVSQQAEMLMLSRLPTLSVVTWRHGIEDPVREWGQLLAYLPLVRRACAEKGGRVIVLPRPALVSSNFIEPRAQLAELGRRTGASVAQIRRSASNEIHDWLDLAGEPRTRFGRF